MRRTRVKTSSRYRLYRRAGRTLRPRRARDGRPSCPLSLRVRSPVYFLVNATHDARGFSFERKSMTDALDKALALLASGMSDVVITHPDGRRSTAAGFLSDCAAPRAGSPAAQARMPRAA